MLRFAGLLALTVLALLAAGTIAETSARTSAIRCDRTLQALKTLSDPQSRFVNFRPRTTTIREINSRRRPHPTPTERNNAFERQVWRVKAQIVKDRLDDHGDIQLVLFDRGSYMIAELPAPACLPRATRARQAIVRARRHFERGCGAAARSWTNQGAVAYISGVGFWDIPNRQIGHARNYAELHPVTGVTFVSGCNGEARGGGG